MNMPKLNPDACLYETKLGATNLGAVGAGASVGHGQQSALSVFLLEVVSILVGDACVDLRGCTRVVHIFNLDDRRQFLCLFEVLGDGLEVGWSVGSNVFDALV